MSLLCALAQSTYLINLYFALLKGSSSLQESLELRFVRALQSAVLLGAAISDEHRNADNAMACRDVVKLIYIDGNEVRT